jgi:hypothetical protein
MRPLAVLLLLAAGLAPAGARAETVIWTQPAPMLLLGPSLQESIQSLRLRSLPVGVNIVTHGKALVLEAIIAPGSRSAECGTTRYWGGWMAAGVLIPLGKSATDGFFIQPKVIATYFNQTNDGSECLDLGQAQWSTFEWDVGVDLGYQLTLGPLYVAPVIGVFAGQCFNCAEGALPTAPAFLGDVESQLRRFNVGFNLNLLRVGVVW